MITWLHQPISGTLGSQVLVMAVYVHPSNGSPWAIYVDEMGEFNAGPLTDISMDIRFDRMKADWVDTDPHTTQELLKGSTPD
jgi:hypothetical protein